MSLIFVPLQPFILSRVHPDQAGAASGVTNAVQQIGGTFGIAVLGAVFLIRLAKPGDYRHAFRAVAQATSRCWH